MKLHVKKGDNVKIIAGSYKGSVGKITAVDAQNGRVVVENANIITKHVKGKGAQKQSSREKLAGSINASNVQIVCAGCNKTTRVAHQEAASFKPGKKIWQRICKKCGAVLDQKAPKVEKEKKVKKAKKEEPAQESAAAETTTEKAAAAKTAKPKKEKIVKNEDGAVV
ncbi:MAG: 50S ribosomal protein L24 [Firmicutes bacterium]|nr:50S ribosomal protein L24 [Bacillota bacterium]